MSTTLEAIYERGTFRPVSDTPLDLKDRERVRITIETDDELGLKAEFTDWERASDEDLAAFETWIEEP